MLMRAHLLSYYTLLLLDYTFFLKNHSADHSPYIPQLYQTTGTEGPGWSRQEVCNCPSRLVYMVKVVGLEDLVNDLLLERQSSGLNIFFQMRKVKQVCGMTFWWTED